ncbi:hypothetical protein [uncultured Microbacterium sp.]|uniref:hypothetical protein n=1 Tax=uncultured Microbacterium sp. TaxID=191216 RepID=UPI0025D6E2EA|nr:hypothetical protein [uncultured Microbacterium sp.]
MTTSDGGAIRHLLDAVANQRKGRQLQQLAKGTLEDIAEGEAIAARGVDNVELVDIVELLLIATQDVNVEQLDAVAVGISAVPGLPARLLAALGGFTLAFADAAGMDWRDELRMRRARLVIDDALG